MQLPLQDFTALVRTQAAAVKGACQQLIDMSVGSVLRAVLEANAAVGLWVQWLIVEVLATTRAATSSGADLDSWVADFGLTRLPAIPAYGLARFSRSTPGLEAVIPPGALVRTGLDSNAQTFSVIADASQLAWNGSGYRLAAGEFSVLVPVIGMAAGKAGNVQAGAIRLLSSAIPGVDAVTNDAPAVGGLDAETDAALRERFSGFIDSRNRATAQAVTYAIQSVRQGLQYAIEERVDAGGVFRAGHFTVTIDDGTGAPSALLLAQVSSAVEAVRPVGGTFSVRAPSILLANVSMHVSAPGAVGPVVQAAVGAHIATLPIGVPLVLSRIIQIAHDAHPQVSSVWGLTINGQAADLWPPGHGLVRQGSVSVLP